MWLWLCFLAVLLFLLYKWGTNTYHKWDGTGIKVMKPPLPFLGSEPMKAITWPPITQSTKDGYHKFFADGNTDPYVVYYFLKEDILGVNDVELIKRIFVKDFDHFTERLVFDAVNELHPETNKMLTTVNGEDWKVLRHSLSPAFTTGRLKGIFEGLDACGPEFVRYVEEMIKQKAGSPLEMKETFKRYTMGSIARSVFGVEARAFETEDSEFVAQAKKLAQVGNDVLQLVLDLQEEEENVGKNKSKEDERTDQNGDGEQFERDAKLEGVSAMLRMDEDVVTQCGFLFLLAGFDTTALTLSLASYYLATNPEKQEKGRAEADEVAEAMGEGGHLTYDIVKRMEYIEMIISETLRLSPATAVVERVCSKEYRLPCGNVVPKGMRVQVPAVGVQTDPRYWEDPEEFRPERFSRENRHKILPGSYLAFGMGSRNCIGMRFALMNTKIALFHLLRNFEIRPSDKTPVPIRYSRENFLTEVEGGNWLHLTPREGI